MESFQRLVTIARAQGQVALHLQNLGEGLARTVVIFDDKDFFGVSQIKCPEACCVDKEFDGIATLTASRISDSRCFFPAQR